MLFSHENKYIDRFSYLHWCTFNTRTRISINKCLKPNPCGLFSLRTVSIWLKFNTGGNLTLCLPKMQVLTKPKKEPVASLLWHEQDLVKNTPTTLFSSIQMRWNFCELDKELQNFWFLFFKWEVPSWISSEVKETVLNDGNFSCAATTNDWRSPTTSFSWSTLWQTPFSTLPPTPLIFSFTM